MYRTPAYIANPIKAHDSGEVGEGCTTMKMISRLAHVAIRMSDVPEYRGGMIKGNGGHHDRRRQGRNRVPRGRNPRLVSD